MTESIFLKDKSLLRTWIDIAPGSFCVADLTKDVDVQTLIMDQLEELVDEGVLDHHGQRRGWYIPKHIELIEMDYQAADDNPVDIWLPFNLTDYVEIYENSVIIISGAPNAGKTAILLNVIRYNRLKGWDIHYFNSEMSAGELKKRLKKFDDITLDMWGFKAYYRADRFADVIFGGKNCLNIIDFLEIHDEFYMVGRKIKEIHDRLKGGIAVIALQKNPGSETGLGGYRTMEVARLALAVDKGKVKISKAKNFAKPDTNPNGWVKNFKIIQGSKILDHVPVGWHREGENES